MYRLKDDASLRGEIWYERNFEALDQLVQPRGDSPLAQIARFHPNLNASDQSRAWARLRETFDYIPHSVLETLHALDYAIVLMPYKARGQILIDTMNALAHAASDIQMPDDRAGGYARGDVGVLVTPDDHHVLAHEIGHALDHCVGVLKALTGVTENHEENRFTPLSDSSAQATIMAQTSLLSPQKIAQQWHTNEDEIIRQEWFAENFAAWTYGTQVYSQQTFRRFEPAFCAWMDHVTGYAIPHLLEALEHDRAAVLPKRTAEAILLR